MKKRKLTGILALSLSGLAAAGIGFQTVAANREITVSDNVDVVFKQETLTPKDVNGRTLPVFAFDGSVYAPIRAVCEAAGLTVNYDPATRTVFVDEPSPSPGPQPGEWDALDLWEKVGSIQVRDGEGRIAHITEKEAVERWIKRLDQTYQPRPDADPSSYEGTGIDLIFFDEEGNYLDKFTDVSEGMVVYQDGFWSLNGCNLDLDRLELLLAGQPDESGPEKLFDVDKIAWAVAHGGDSHSGKRVAIKGEDLEKLRENLKPLSFQKGERLPMVIGCPIGLTLYDENGRVLGGFEPLGEGTVELGRYEYAVTGGEIDWEAVDQLLQDLPEAERPDWDPILTLEGALRADCVLITNGMETERVWVHNPELVKRLAENMGKLEFRVGEHVQGSAWDRVDDGRVFVYWMNGNEYAEITTAVLDENTIAFSGDNGYYGSPLEGKIDKTLIDQLLGPTGPYMDTEGLQHEAAGIDANGEPVWPEAGE